MTRLDIIIPFPLSESSFKHLARYLFPNGASITTNAELQVWIDLSVTGMTGNRVSETARGALKLSFAAHFSISPEHVLVAYPGEGGYR